MFFGVNKNNYGMKNISAWKLVFNTKGEIIIIAAYIYIYIYIYIYVCVYVCAHACVCVCCMYLVLSLDTGVIVRYRCDELG